MDTARYVNPSCQLTQLAPSDGSPGLVTANAQHYLDIKWKFLFLYVSKSPKEAKPAAFIFGLILTTPAQFPTGSPKPLLSSLRQAGMDSLPPDNTQGHLTGADAATAAGLLVRLLRPVLERDGGTGSAIQSPDAMKLAPRYYRPSRLPVRVFLRPFDSQHPQVRHIPSCNAGAPALAKARCPGAPCRVSGRRVRPG